MEVDVTKRNKNQIIENIKATVDSFNEREDIRTEFGKPVVAFLSTDHPLFDTFFARGENDHPKKLYRPGNTLIIHYVPWEGSVEPDADSWLAADRESLWLAMEINKEIKRTLNKVGRLHSNTSTMIDWDREKHRYGWSNKIAAFIAGMGEFGPAGSFHVGDRYGGRIGSIITAALYADRPELHEDSPELCSDGQQEESELGQTGSMTDPDPDPEKLEDVFRKMMKDCRFAGYGGEKCSDEMIAACPGGAIDVDGIDRQKCQDWCETIDKYTPAPEVCGGCFRFR